MPSAASLEAGIVNKYYVHTKKEKSHDITTDIEYRSYQLNDMILINKYYNPAFELDVAKKIRFETNKMLLIEEEQYFRGDTFPTIIKQALMFDWE